MNSEASASVKHRLDQAQKVLVAAHIRPDGDAIGSLLGLGLALENAGKSVQMILVDGVPHNFSHLDESDRIKTRPEGESDTFIVVDSADFKRVGEALHFLGQPDINIDHHKTNEMFGVLNLVEPEAVATASVLTKYLPAWDFEITKSIAASLATGMITDTLGFRTSNMTPEAMRQMALLMECGIDMPDLYRRALVSRTFEAARYWGAGLSSLERSDDIVWGTLRLSDRVASTYSGKDDADLINVISAIDCCAVGMIFVEQVGGSVKVSWRGLRTDVDVSPVARHFGGGGHAAAAGADISGTMEDVKSKVLEITREMLGLG